MAFVSLKEFLARMGLATAEQFDGWSKAWKVAVESGSQESLLGFICRERGLAEDLFLQQLAQALNWAYLDLPKLKVPAEARDRISTKVAFQYGVVPVQVQDGTLQVAVSNPFDPAMLNAVRFDARGPVRFALATKTDIEKALKNFYGVGAETLGELEQEATVDLDLPLDKEITESDQEASVIKFVNQVIWEAYKDRSTDIHFEPAEDELRIRYRIDGILHDAYSLPLSIHSALISRVKILAEMNIAEQRRSQDGQFSFKTDSNSQIDIRVATMLSLVARFMPVIVEQAARTSDAQRARAGENRRNPIRRLTAFGIPLMRRTFETAEHLAVAMEARCYSETRTDPDLTTGRKDWVLFGTAVAMILTAAAL